MTLKTKIDWLAPTFGGRVAMRLPLLLSLALLACGAAGSRTRTVSEESGWSFKLTRGKGTPVCDAYLQRINERPNDRSPYCGFPEETRVPGFDRLPREWMEWTDIQNVDDDLALFAGQGRVSSDHHKTPVLFKGSPGVYRFSGGVDIENDGRPDNVLMWSFEGRRAPTCGQYFGTPPELDKHGSVGVILTTDGKHIDVERTQRVFGSRLGGFYIIAGNPPKRTFQRTYTPIGLGYNLFEYRGLYYYSTFLGTWYDFDDAKSRAGKDEDILGVFVAKRGHHHQGVRVSIVNRPLSCTERTCLATIHPLQ